MMFSRLWYSDELDDEQKTKYQTYRVLDSSTKHLELPPPTSLPGDDVCDQNDSTIQVTVYNLPPPTGPDRVQLIFKRRFDQSNHTFDIKKHITKELGIPAEAQIILKYYQRSKSYRASPLPENIKLSYLSEKGDHEESLTLLLAVCQQRSECREKFGEKLNEYNIAELSGLTVRGFATKHIMMMLGTTFSIDLVRLNILNLTGLPSDEQLIYDRNGLIVTSDLPKDCAFKDLYVATTSLRREVLCFDYSIKVFKMFKLTFLTKMEELELGKYPTIADVKNYLFDQHQIHKHNQSLMLQGTERQDSEEILALAGQEWSCSNKELILHLLVIRGKFDVLFAPCWESDFQSGTNWSPITVQDSSTVEEVKTKLAEYLRVETLSFKLSLKDAKTKGEFLPNDKTIKDFDSTFPIRFKYHPVYTYRVFSNESEIGELLEEKEIMLDTEITGWSLVKTILKKYSRTKKDIRPVPVGKAARYTSRFRYPDDLNHHGLDESLWRRWEEGQCVQEFVIYKKTNDCVLM